MTNPFHVGRTLESLRNSNFDTLSAMGEVLDNSIQANADNIHIKIKTKELRKNKVDLTEVAFADDGKGMDKKILAKCLQLGFSERYNDRDGIGRFGVGMTLGAVTQCTRIEVYSKPKGGGWNFMYIDLDEMKDKEDAIMSSPRPAEIPREYAELMDDYGTLVIWKNWDREDAKIEDMEIWIGRTYRKFIGKQIINKDNNVVKNPHQRHIFLNGKKISSLDPLYVTNTDYNKEVTELESPIILEQHPHEFDKPPKKSAETSKIVIRMSLLPEQWRPKRRAGNYAENKKRLVHKNEGISILRNDREVFFGHIPYYRIRDDTSSHYKGFIDLDRFWGCEISFNADMDHWFSIKNIKVGARPLPELREIIEHSINPTITDFRENIRNLWDFNKNKERNETKGEVTGTDDAEQILGTGTNGDKDASDDITDILKASGKIKKETEWRIQERLANNPIVFYKSYDMDERGNFMDIISKGGKSLLKLNMQHPFFQRFFDLQDDMTSAKKYKKKDLENLSQHIETNLQILLGAFVLGKKDLNTERDEQAKDAIDKLLNNWTFYLHKHAKLTLEDTDKHAQ